MWWRERGQGAGPVTEARDAALAMPPAQFAALGHALVDRLAQELAGLRQRPVATGETAAEVRSALGAALPLPAAGQDPAALLDAASALLFEHSTLGSHPRFHAYIAAAPAPIGVLAELLAAAFNANVAAWHAAPMASEMEAQTLRWLAELVGYGVPADAALPCGLLTSGGSAGNAIAVQLALHGALPQAREQGLGAARLAVYACDQAHAWLPRTLEQCGLGRQALRSIAGDARQRLPLDALARAIAADRAAGVTPLMVVGSAGTVATGAVDPLAAIAALCREQRLWFHVDGAYGAPAACLAGSVHAARLGDAAADLAALSQADTLALDPHKWLSAPIEAGALLLRDPARLRAAFGAERPSYYGPPDDAAGAGADFHALGPQNTRGFRALKVWLALRMAGRAGYRAIIAGDIALAERLHARVQATPPLEAVTRSLGVACFRYRPRGLDDEAALNALNRALLARLQADGRAFLSPAVVDGRFLLRACIVNFHTTEADIDALPPLVVELGDALRR